MAMLNVFEGLGNRTEGTITPGVEVGEAPAREKPLPVEAPKIACTGLGWSRRILSSSNSECLTTLQASAMVERLP